MRKGEKRRGEYKKERERRERVVLVSVLKSRRDLAIVRREHWYRIPERYAPKRNFWYLAFYQPAVFGREGKRIRYYARVLGRRSVPRLSLLPRERTHPQARERYVRLRVGAILSLPRPVRNIAPPRRISFCFTTLKRLLHSRTILEMYGVARTEEVMERALRRADIAAIPQYYVRAGNKGVHKRYRLDFAVFGAHGAVAIECDNARAHAGARQREKDSAKDRYLRRRGWAVLRFTERDILSDAEGCIAHVCRALR